MSAAHLNGASGGGPIVRRMQLGGRLRALREARGITRDEAGWAIRGSESKISRMELGRVGFKERDVTDLLKLYGVENPAEHAEMLGWPARRTRPAGGRSTPTCCRRGSRTISASKRRRR